MEINVVYCEACPNVIRLPKDSWTFPNVSKIEIINGTPCLWAKCQIEKCGHENLFNLFDLTRGIETRVKED